MAEGSQLSWRCVGVAHTLRRKVCQHLHAKSNKNDDLVLLVVNQRFYAMEAWCSHLGGPLYKGDIEDFKGKPHLMCPWHGYMFKVEDGTNSIGLKQEVFPTKVEDGKLWILYKSELSLQPYPKLPADGN